MTSVRRWGLLSSAAAPVLLIGGWTLAARLQSEPFSSMTGTISALAARDADHRWVMTLALAGVGACHMITAWALRPSALAGRVLLAAAGLATLGVAAFPLPSADGESSAHTLVAGAAFGALALWPALSWRRRRGGTGSSEPRLPAWALRPATAVGASAVLLAAVGWFVVEWTQGTDRVGLSERVAAGLEAVWPFAVVVSASYQRGWMSARSRSL